ncbi:hypothetical protein [Phytoactinopolyspora halotolerans]|uniref:Uncharacterized protein n=1 Tax=Phytoactinopolyspora halotolerans TaxID=1981512 RepID=A0A6L9SID1_9ACTN|nr:hypothetical protein [Phytoactinopolyspora halotolerans]NEE04192.1 hypothetical protein [Phytoactinopolyspora halotolerans]
MPDSSTSALSISVDERAMGNSLAAVLTARALDRGMVIQLRAAWHIENSPDLKGPIEAIDADVRIVAGAYSVYANNALVDILSRGAVIVFERFTIREVRRRGRNGSEPGRHRDR